MIFDKKGNRKKIELVARPAVQQMDCGPTQCTYITCRVGPLKKKEDVVFRVRSRLWTSTLAKLTNQQYEISSR